MAELSEEQLARIGAAKALALGCYGEDMAAYRYLQLSEKAQAERERREFREMVVEEQAHRERLKALLDKHFPGAEYVLTPEEKHMVESGSRSLKITDRESFEEALRMVIESERMTAQFYGRMAPHVNEPEIREIFMELADEGFEHHQRLRQIAAQNNITDS